MCSLLAPALHGYRTCALQQCEKNAQSRGGQATWFGLWQGWSTPGARRATSAAPIWCPVRGMIKKAALPCAFAHPLSGFLFVRLREHCSKTVFTRHLRGSRKRPGQAPPGRQAFASSCGHQCAFLSGILHALPEKVHLPKKPGQEPGGTPGGTGRRRQRAAAAGMRVSLSSRALRPLRFWICWPSCRAPRPLRLCATAKAKKLPKANAPPSTTCVRREGHQAHLHPHLPPP